MAIKVRREDILEKRWRQILFEGIVGDAGEVVVCIGVRCNNALAHTKLTTVWKRE